MEFPERLQKLRNENNMTQTELAKKLNIKQQAVSNYEKGTSYPKPEMLRKLAVVFNIPIGYLMGFTDDPFSKEIPNDAKELLEIYDSLPFDKKNISIELLRVLKDTSKKEV